MLNIFIVAAAVAALYLLNLTGKDEPAWVPYSMGLLLIVTIGLVAAGLMRTVHRELHEEKNRIDAARDEHREHAI